MQTAEQILQASILLKTLIKNRETDIIARWRAADDYGDRQAAWYALRELDILAGAIDDGIREHSTDGE